MIQWSRKVEPFVICLLVLVDLLSQRELAAINVNINELNLDTQSEQLLIEKLFKVYNKKVRPPGTIQIKFALNLNQIVNLIEKDQIIVLNAFIDHEWTDERLAWSEFSSS
jgi:hypothetical protein